jgi:hypothetical protein
MERARKETTTTTVYSCLSGGREKRNQKPSKATAPRLTTLEVIIVVVLSIDHPDLSPELQQRLFEKLSTSILSLLFVHLPSFPPSDS